MRTSVKAALAGVVGAGLLLGGAGSLAFWNDTQTENGGTIESGTLNLLNRDCSEWKVVGGTGSVDLFGDFLVVPGTKVAKTCTYGIEVEGVLNATLSLNRPDVSDTTLGAELDVTPVFSFLDADNNATADEIAMNDVTGTGTWLFDQADNGKQLKAVITVELPFEADTANNNANSLVGDSKEVAPSEGATPVSTPNVPLKSVLDDLTVTVKQTPA